MGNSCCGGQRLRFKDYVVDIYPTHEQLKRREKSPDTPDLNALGKLKDYVKTNPDKIPRICRKLRKLMVSHIERGEVLRVNLGLFILKSLIGDVDTVTALDYFAAPAIDLIEMSFQFANLMTIAEADRQRAELGKLATTLRGREDSTLGVDDVPTGGEMFALTTTDGLVDDEGQMEYRIGAADVLAALTFQLHKVAQASDPSDIASGAFDTAGAASRRLLTDAANTLLRPTIRLSAEGLGSNDVVALHYRYSSVVIVGNYASCIRARLNPMMGEVLPIVLANFLFSLRFLKQSASRSSGKHKTNANRVGGQYEATLTYVHQGGLSDDALSRVDLCKSVILPVRADDKDNAFLQASVAALHQLSMCPTDAEVLSFCRGVSDFCFRTQAWRQPFVLEHLFKVVSKSLIVRPSPGAEFVLIQHLCDVVCRQFIAVDDRASLCGALVAIQVVLLECANSCTRPVASNRRFGGGFESNTSLPYIVFELVLSLLSRLSTYANIDWAERAAGYERLAAQLQPTQTPSSSHETLEFPSGPAATGRPPLRARIVTPVRQTSQQHLDASSDTYFSPAASVRNMLISPSRDGKAAQRRGAAGQGTSTTKPLVLFEVVMGVLSTLWQLLSLADSPTCSTTLQRFAETLVSNASKVPSRAALCGHLEALSLLGPAVRRCPRDHHRQRIGLLSFVFPLLGKLDDPVWDSAMNCVLGYLRLLPEERDGVLARVVNRYGCAESGRPRETRREAAQLRASGAKPSQAPPTAAADAASVCVRLAASLRSPIEEGRALVDTSIEFMQSTAGNTDPPPCGVPLADDDREGLMEVLSHLLLVSTAGSRFDEEDAQLLHAKHTPHTLEMTAHLASAMVQLLAERSLPYVLPLALAMDTRFSSFGNVPQDTRLSPALRQCLCHVAVSIVNSAALTLQIPSLHAYCKTVVAQRSKSDRVPRDLTVEGGKPAPELKPLSLSPSLLSERATPVLQPQFGIWFTSQLGDTYEPLQAGIRATPEHEDTVLAEETAGAAVTTNLSPKEIFAQLCVHDELFAVLADLRGFHLLSYPTLTTGNRFRSALAESPEAATALLLATSFFTEDTSDADPTTVADQGAGPSEAPKPKGGVAGLIKSVLKGIADTPSSSLTGSAKAPKPAVPWDEILRRKAQGISLDPVDTMRKVCVVISRGAGAKGALSKRLLATPEMAMSDVRCSWGETHISVDTKRSVQLKVSTVAFELPARCSALLTSMGLSRTTRHRPSISDAPFYLSPQFIEPDGRPVPYHVIAGFLAHCFGGGKPCLFMGPLLDGMLEVPSPIVNAVQSEVATFPVLSTSVFNYTVPEVAGGSSSPTIPFISIEPRSSMSAIENPLPQHTPMFLRSEFSDVFSEVRDKNSSLRAAIRERSAPRGWKGGLGRYGGARRSQPFD